MSASCPSNKRFHGGLRTGFGWPPISTMSVSSKLNRVLWKQGKKQVYLKHDVHGTWRPIKTAVPFPNDFSFAVYLLSLEMKRPWHCPFMYLILSFSELYLDSRVTLIKSWTENILALCLFSIHDNYTAFALCNFFTRVFFVPSGLFSAHGFDIRISLNDEISIF